MFELIFKPLEILFETNLKLSNKLAYFLVIALTALILNDYTGFLFNYKVTATLEQIKTLKELENFDDKNLDFEISRIKNEVLDRKTIPEKFFLLFVSNKHSYKYDNKIIINWRSFSASILFILTMVLIPIPLILRQEYTLTIILQAFFVEILLIVFIVISIKLLSLIPDFKHLIWNHIINIFGSSLIAKLTEIIVRWSTKTFITVKPDEEKQVE